MGSEAPEILRFRGIDQKAKDWENEGFKVKANIGGWDRPPTVEGIIPDIKGDRGDDVRIGCVELEEDGKIDETSWDILVAYSTKNKKASVRLYTISRDGDLKLKQIIP